MAVVGQLSKGLLKDLVSARISRGFDTWIVSAALSSHIRNTNTHTCMLPPLPLPYVCEAGIRCVGFECVCCVVADAENELRITGYNM